MEEEEEEPTQLYTVEYQFATYQGTRRVVAVSHEHAIAKVRKWVNAQSSLTMAYEHYKVISVESGEE